MAGEGTSAPVSSDPKTTQSQAGPEGARDDVVSDPAKGAEDRVDWSDEGGASPDGPAAND